MNGIRSGNLGRLSLLVALAGAVGLPAPAWAAATQPSAQVNEFLFGNSLYSFSVSKYSTSGETSSSAVVAASVPGGAWTNVVQPDGGYIGYIGGRNVSGSFKGAYGTASGSGVNATSGVAFTAPITGAGVATTGNYVFATEGGAAVSNVQGMTYLGRAGYGALLHVKSIEILWGSVEASNAMGVVSNTGTTQWLTGEDVLSAASMLGMAEGNLGSFYVTLNVNAAVNPNLSISQLNGRAGATGTTMEYMPTSYSTSERVAVDIPPPPLPPAPSNSAPVGAPSPVVGSTPAGGMLALGLVGYLGLGRRRLAAGARAAA